MTSAPSNLLAARRLLLDELGPYGLQPLAVGIVGDPDHWGGYHCGSDRVLRYESGTIRDYSVIESPRDRDGLSSYASALDVGTFTVRSAGRTHNLQTFSAWCVAQCVNNTPDTRHIREIIYFDGVAVRRWDRLGKRTSGDDSHKSHTHFSFFRDATEAGWDLLPLFRRYLTLIGLIQEIDMTPEEHAWLETVHRNLTVLDGRNPVGQIYTRMAKGTDDKLRTDGETYKPDHATLNGLAASLAAVQGSLAALQGQDWVNEDQIVQGVLTGLGARSEPEVAQALVAAGVDPVALAEALLALPPQEPAA